MDATVVNEGVIAAATGAARGRRMKSGGGGGGGGGGAPIGMNDVVTGVMLVANCGSEAGATGVLIAVVACGAGARRGGGRFCGRGGTAGLLRNGNGAGSGEETAGLASGAGVGAAW